MKTYTCVVCGNDFQAKRKAKTCSAACRQAKSRKTKPSPDLSVTNVTSQIPMGYIMVLEGEWKQLKSDLKYMREVLQDIALGRISDPKGKVSQSGEVSSDQQQNTKTDNQHQSNNLPVPNFDDELPLIEVKKSDKVEDGNQNFLNSLMAFG